MTNTVDPLGGSYAVEKLTDEIERGAEEYLSKIEAMGGMLKYSSAPRSISSVSFSTAYEPPSGSTVFVTPLS
ncbi:MAG: methylmalonyl-CoA mutase family protein [Deltaproteobacteria bacterium]